MKRIKGLEASTAGLARFLADPATEKTWDEFGSFETGAARRELTDALAERQHGLCAYCEIDLRAGDTRVEHFVPQSDPVEGERRACDYTNLLAVCMGGSNAAIFGPATKNPNQARFLPPVAKNLSCDAAKDDSSPIDLLDPRLVPALPSLVEVTPSGELIPDPNACAQHGIAETAVETHVRRLGLNVGRLRINRVAVWNALQAAADEIAHVEAVALPSRLRRFASDLLLPDANDRLSAYFTTIRSFFGPVAKGILNIPPHEWI